MIKDLKGAN
jgi:hypothetical protein